MEPGANRMDLTSNRSANHYYTHPSRSMAADFATVEEWSIIDCVRILRRNRVTLSLITAVSLAVAALICVVQPRYFQSTASLELQNINETFLNLRDIYPTASPSADSTGIYIQTQVEVLQQDALIDLVAKRLRLDQRPEFVGGRTLWEGLFHASRRNSQSARHNLIGEVKRHIQVIPIRNSRVIEIVSDSQDRQLAADIANTLAEVFITERTEERRREAQHTYDSLRLPLQKLRHQIAQAEATFEAYGIGIKVDAVHNASAIPPNRGPLKSELDTDLRFYQGMLQRFNDAAFASVVLQGNLRLINRALPADSPYRPNVALNLSVGILGGFLLGACWVMLKEQTRSVMRSCGEAGRYLTLPELGAVPRFSDRALGLPVNFEACREGLTEKATGLDHQRLNLSEVFRTTLASMLSTGDATGPPRTLVVTSALPAEGKTMVISNLGIALTDIADKVLLIDGDMRRPRLHKVLRQANSWGLSDILREKNAIEDVPVEALVKKTDVPHLYFLPSGPYTDNIFGLLYSERLSQLLVRCRQEFDYVLIDAPPCLEFADARLAARCADTVLLVVRADSTSRQTAQTAVRRLLMDGIPLIGVILNHCDPDQSGLYGYVT